MKFWKELAFAAALFAVSFGCLYAADARAQTVGNMPATQNVHVCDSGTACDDVPTVPAERQLKGLTDFIKALLGPLESRVTDLETLVSSLLTRVTTLEGDVATLQGQQATAPTQSQITQLQQQIADLQAAVVALQANDPGKAKAWWGRISSSNNPKSHNLTAPPLSNQLGMFTFTDHPMNSSNYNIALVQPGGANCEVTSRSTTGFYVVCGTASMISSIRSVLVFDN